VITEVREAADLAVFWAYVVAWAIRQLYNDLPGPRPVRIALIVICFLIPGGFDELALVAIARANRAYRNRKRS
jgi:hypothetical protein